jgi:hypothetical protein
MNITSSAFFAAKSLREKLFPEITSGRLKSAAGVPSGRIVDGVKDMEYPPYKIILQGNEGKE